MIQIFLAEDNPEDVYLVREALNEAQLEYTLAVAPDGESALQHLQLLSQLGTEHIPDVILLDLRLPKVEGNVVLQGLRGLPGFSAVPVVITTSSTSPRERSRVEALGATRFFCKPTNLFDFLSLGALVRDLVKQQQRAGSGQGEHNGAGHDQ